MQVPPIAPDSNPPAPAPGGGHGNVVLWTVIGGVTLGSFALTAHEIRSTRARDAGLDDWWDPAPDAEWAPRELDPAGRAAVARAKLTTTSLEQLAAQPMPVDAGEIATRGRSAAEHARDIATVLGEAGLPRDDLAAFASAALVGIEQARLAGASLRPATAPMGDIGLFVAGLTNDAARQLSRPRHALSLLAAGDVAEQAFPRQAQLARGATTWRTIEQAVGELATHPGVI